MASEGDSVMWLRVEDEDIDEAKLLRVTVNENTTGNGKKRRTSFHSLSLPSHARAVRAGGREDCRGELREGHIRVEWRVGGECGNAISVG